jgi:sorbitol/mannitol transport system permease protein
MARTVSLQKRWTWTILAWIVALLIFFPILWTILTAFKTEGEAIAFPPHLIPNWTLENFFEVQSQSNYFGHFFNSVVIAVGSTVLGLIIAVLAAWSMAFSPMTVPDRKLTLRLYAIMPATLIVAAAFLYIIGDARQNPFIDTVVAIVVAAPIVVWIATRNTRDILMWMLSTKMMPAVGVLVPIYLIFKTLNMIDNLFGLTVILALIDLPIVVWMLYTYFKEIPVDILEASRMDGAVLWKEIAYVLLPMAVPGIASTCLLNVILAWNEAFWTLNLTTINAAPLTAFIASFSAPEGLFWAKLSAASTLAIAPILLLGWFSQRQLVRGLTFGAVK